MQTGDTITFEAAPGQTFAGGLTTAPAIVQSVDDGKAIVLVMPEGGEPFQAVITP